MKTGRYSLKELLTHNEIEQIIIPEIQRDYVWKISNVGKLIDDIYKNYEKKINHQLEIKINGVAENNESVNQFLTKEYERLKYNQKLGFIYAYHDRDYAGKFFLIDGQQRLTTLFLILLFLYKELDKTDAFRLLYFNNGIPKVNYKVREESNDFLQLLIKSELKGENYENSEKFYKSEYFKDVTISHLITNYDYIKKHISNIKNKAAFLEYLEDFVEVNYFDTHLSEQGEQLYIYMNSRGEQLSFQEIVRAELMQKITNPQKKIELGNEWEKWQNFFWVNRGENENADNGFEEFLKWSAIIHIGLNDEVELINFVNSEKEFTKKEFTKKELKENYIKVFGDSLIRKKQSEALFKYQVNYFDFDFLKGLFNSILFLYENKTKFIPIDQSWLSGKISLIDYVVLLPLIQYIAQNEWLTEEENILDVERIAMFLKNTNYFEGVYKNPDTATLDALFIIKKLICDKKNISNIKDLANVSQTIVTDAENEKFDCYMKANSERRILEEYVWNITLDHSFNEFLMGDISVLFKCLEFENSEVENRNELETLKEYNDVLRDVIFKNKNSDRLRRLILTKFDYLIGGKTGGGLNKYSFIGNGNSWEVLKEWRKLFKKELFINLLSWIKVSNHFDLKILLENAMAEFLYDDWRSSFIKYSSLLKYCGDKKILWENDSRILLLEKTNYSIANSKEIQCALLQSKFKECGMWIHENNCCVLEFDFANDEIQFKEKNNKTFALDIVYHSAQLYWSFTFSHKEKNISEIVNVAQSDIWKKIDVESSKWIEKDRLTNTNDVLYNYNPNLSLIRNNMAVTTKINELFLDIKTLLG